MWLWWSVYGEIVLTLGLLAWLMGFILLCAIVLSEGGEDAGEGKK